MHGIYAGRWPLMGWVLLAVAGTARADGDLFRQQVAPILQRRCLSCHNDRERKGDFSVQSAGSALESGYIQRGDAEASHLIEVLTPVDGKAAMPKNADPLSAAELRAIRDWIHQGARWPADLRLSEPVVADLDWWSLRPLRRPDVPRFDPPPSGNPPASNKPPASDKPPAAGGPSWQSGTAGQSGPSGQSGAAEQDAARAASSGRLPLRTPIDAFIQARLDQRGLQASPEADRRTLIRRLHFDLLGLPPTPEEVEAFVGDERPRAYERLVDRLLESPHYGERWARHWLDVVHYADTHGYDKDKPRPNAWPYRDYVIRSLNADKPYQRFVREQIAGDILWPDTLDGVTATGFIAAGPWDFIGHVEVPESKIDGRIARHLDRDDMVSSTMNTFCSTTVQCARCHNHKFDPVTQEHYYSLQAVFAALDRADRPFDQDPETAARRAELARREQQLQNEQAELEAAVRQAGGTRLAEIDGQLAELRKRKETSGAARPEFGYHSQIESDADVAKWVQVDLGEPVAVQSVVYVGCHDTFNGIGHGFGFPVRYKIELSDDPEFQSQVHVLVDHTGEDRDNPGTELQTVRLPSPLTGRYVRVTATRLAERKNDYIFALAELEVRTPEGRNVALGKPVTSADSIEAPVRWQRKNLVDGYYFGVTADGELGPRIAELVQQRETLLEQSLSDDLRSRIARNRSERKQTAESLQQLPPPGKVYAGTVHHGSGNFRGTGDQDGQPRTIHVLHRGNILSPGDEVGPGTLPVIPGVDWRFELSEPQQEGQRRVALAEWLVHRDNPLTWRSIVNRVWQYHFGRGIVDSPNDFGRMGKEPSHPELLDWLAVEFRDGGQSLKQLHKLIVTSSVYRQVSRDNPHNRELDSENVFLWRMNRRRLTAEEVRDAVLAVSGKLDPAMYGPGFQLFVVERPEHSPHYEYDKHDPDDPRSHRRSIYRFIVRSQPDPFMTTLDCADSSQSVARRDETVTALQALSLLNNPFMTRMAEHFGQRLQAEGEPAEARVRRAFQLVAGRDADDEEQAALGQYAERFGWDNACRLLFNLNEFVFID